MHLVHLPKFYHFVHFHIFSIFPNFSWVLQSSHEKLGVNKVHYGLPEVVNVGGSRCNIINREEINKDGCFIKIVCFFEANRTFACCLILLFDFSQSGRKSMSDNGYQTNLHGQEKIHPSNCSKRLCSQ